MVDLSKIAADCLRLKWLPFFLWVWRVKRDSGRGQRFSLIGLVWPFFLFIYDFFKKFDLWAFFLRLKTKIFLLDLFFMFYVFFFFFFFGV